MKRIFCAVGVPCFAVALALVCAGCPAGRPAANPGNLTGWVDDTEGNRLPLVKVTLPGGSETYTDGHGLYTFDQAPAGDDQVVQFTLDGYAPDSRVVDIAPGGITSAEATLTRLGTKQAVSDGTGTASDGAGNTLTIAGTDLAGTGAKDISGSVNVRISAVATAGAGQGQGAPGGFSGQQGGQTFMLEAYAMANFSVTQNGKELQLKAGASAQIQITLAEGAPVNPGDEIPLWYFNAQAGAWVQVGTATIEAGAGATLVGTAQVDCFGWWCCAVTIPQGHTMTGHAYDQGASPLADALIIAKGLDYCGFSLTRTGADGAYSIVVKPDAQVRLELVPQGAYYSADTLDLTAGAAGATTPSQDLTISFTSCISGTVTEEDGTPIAGETVYSSAGGTAVTDASGRFCMPAPGDTYVAVYVLGRPPKVVLTPASASCGASDCVDVTLAVNYPQDGDLIGYIVSTLNSVDHLILPDEKLLSSTALLYSGLEGDQFGLYEGDVTTDTCEVYTTTIVPSFDLSVFLSIGLDSTLAFDLVFNLDYELNMPFQNLGVPEGEEIGALDAGSPGLLTNGTTNINMVRPLDYYYDFTGTGSLADLGYACLEPWMAGFYFQEGLVAKDVFDNGDTLTYSWPGGIDLGPFAVSGDIPGQLSITSPANLSNLFSAANLADGLTLEWDVTAPGDFVNLLIETVVIDSAKGLVDFGAIVCRLVDDGSYTIPAATLAQLPQPDGLLALQTNYLLAMRHGITAADVPLRRGTGNGRVLLVTGTEPVHAWGIDAHLSLKDSAGDPELQ